MQHYLADELARERIAEFRRDADRYRLAALARSMARSSRRARRTKPAPLARQPGSAAA